MSKERLNHYTKLNYYTKLNHYTKERNSLAGLPESEYAQ
jgi:hypothetical protein